jgi:hypothetical protein
MFDGDTQSPNANTRARHSLRSYRAAAASRLAEERLSICGKEGMLLDSFLSACISFVTIRDMLMVEENTFYNT